MKKILKLLVVILILTGCGHHTKIEQYHSRIDRDGDGIDDQIDILKNAKAYVATRPQYKSRYYETGYPDDHYGVCTDVVGYALKNAGYDLQHLVDQDIKTHKDDYHVGKRDPKIDFRRVVNLDVYFKHAAQSLTLDVDDVEAWQGGDIVVFTHHIGIVSAKRNRNGVPYVIHHAHPFQLFYEQDILTKRHDIIGHYRIS
ncbi:MAG: DUF1287 domain-containing protein [Erysipelotrichaceae bacterium]|nr:DUF1287 domain-containing protein [Erysipelotrichaceae bacterium]